LESSARFLNCCAKRSATSLFPGPQSPSLISWAWRAASREAAAKDQPIDFTAIIDRTINSIDEGQWPWPDLYLSDHIKSAADKILDESLITETRHAA
jgi:hypothetical protein